MSILSVAISFLALCISCIALWKGYFARFSPSALAGNLHHHVYPIRNGGERWYISSFDAPVSVTNPGARPGSVTGLRLRLRYPDLPIPGNYELVPAERELKPDKLNHINQDRFNWLDEVVAHDWSPFVVLPQATVAKHFLFETRWDRPVVQNQIVATLELQADWRAEWLTVVEWKLALPPQIWVTLENGGSIGYRPKRNQPSHEPECSPLDLHDYTGPNSPLPKEGIAGEPSYLDYPESKED